MLKLLLAASVAVVGFTGYARAADLYVPPQPAPVLAPVMSNWEGGYAGVNLGYGPGTWTPDDVDYTIDFSGWFGGVQAGYNVAVGNGIILGVEGDINLTNESGSHSTTDLNGPYTDNFKLDWTGALTGHVGVPLDNFMPYVLAGLAVAHGSQNDAGYNDRKVAYTGTSSATHVGFTVGAGVAAAISDNISAFVEARYSDYGSATYNYSATDAHTSTYHAGITDASVRVGLNFHM